jgi:hypothetical protein
MEEQHGSVFLVENGWSGALEACCSDGSIRRGPCDRNHQPKPKPTIAAKTRAVSFFMPLLAFVFELVSSRSSPAMILRSTFVYLPLAKPFFLGSYQRSISNRLAPFGF